VIFDLGAANHYPAAITDPDRFGPDRDNRRYLAFGRLIARSCEPTGGEPPVRVVFSWDISSTRVRRGVSALNRTSTSRVRYRHGPDWETVARGVETCRTSCRPRSGFCWQLERVGDHRRGWPIYSELLRSD
jgi:hypothetical protein